MRITADLVRELMAAGVTGDALVTLLLRFERHSDGHAARQARYRLKKKEKQKQAAAESDVTRDAPPSISLSSLNKKDKKERKKGESEGKTLTLCPDDWHQPPEFKLTERGERLRKEMILWSQEKRVRRHDWWLTFQKWALKHEEPCFVPTLTVVPTNGVFVAYDSPEWEAWAAYGRTIGKSYPLGLRSGGWMFESQWPPDFSGGAFRESG